MNYDTYSEIIKYLNFTDIINLSETNKEYNYYYKNLKETNLWKTKTKYYLLLKKYKVDYKDPGNFIYKMNNVSQEEVKKLNETEDYKTIYEYYYKFFNETEIKCQYKGITSLPELPNCTDLYCNDNKLTSFPELPNCEYLYCRGNQLTSLPNDSFIEK